MILIVKKNTRVEGQPQFKPVVHNEIEPVMQGWKV